MATRFGSSRPRAAYIAQLKWIVGGLLAVIFILLGTLISLAQSTRRPADPLQQQTQVSVVPANPAIDILVAQGRIEAGAELTPAMFAKLSLPVDQIPLGAVLARDAQFVLGKYAASLINANQPLTADTLSNSRSLSYFQRKIPPGFRAVTIKADVQDLVEGYVQPDSRVDVLFTYKTDRGEKRTGTLVAAVQILSVNGQTAQQFSAAPKSPGSGTATVSLLVREDEARKISLARELGSLTLVLLGDQEIPGAATSWGSIGMDKIVPSEAPEPEETEPQGRLIINDANGRPVLYELNQKGHWKRRLS